MKKTTLCYIEKDGCYLLLHRTKKANDPNHDKWIGIGGRIEPGETPELCIRREALEETGLTLGSLRYCGVISFLSDLYESEEMYLFHCTDFEGSLLDCNEGVLEWVTLADFAKLPQWEGDKIFLRLMQENVPFFRLQLVYKGDCLKRVILNDKPMERYEG